MSSFWSSHLYPSSFDVMSSSRSSNRYLLSSHVISVRSPTSTYFHHMSPLTSPIFNYYSCHLVCRVTSLYLLSPHVMSPVFTCYRLMSCHQPLPIIASCHVTNLYLLSPHVTSPTVTHYYFMSCHQPLPIIASYHVTHLYLLLLHVMSPTSTYYYFMSCHPPLPIFYFMSCHPPLPIITSCHVTNLYLLSPVSCHPPFPVIASCHVVHVMLIPHRGRCGATFETATP